MPSKFDTTDIRYIRLPHQEDESYASPPSADEAKPAGDLEVGEQAIDEFDGGDVHPQTESAHGSVFLQNLRSIQPLSIQTHSWARRKRIVLFDRWLGCGRRSSCSDSDQYIRRRKTPRPLRYILKCLAITLMLLGSVELIILISSLTTAFFPESYEYISARPSKPSLHWPTDYTADIQPVQCHSHNDYWRRVPLKSAIRAGCTSVEADVWYFPDQSSTELYVGHSTASLTPSRTFRSLYVDPLVEILKHQNPNTSFHSSVGKPRNGIFDVNAAQTLVLLVDFKTDGEELWPIVSQQLEPLRSERYLTYFNGTAVVNGPITIVVTGNAPFRKVVENSTYRDMFFDAPLELLASLADTSDKIHSASSIEGLESWKKFDRFEEYTYLDSLAKLDKTTKTRGKSNQGQGHSGAAPKNAAIYTPANSYYASVSFGKSIGHLFPYIYLTDKQKTKIRHQIAGAHKQGLKVRYWDTPGWPRGLREYIWRVLVEEGIDCLSVDDLSAATRGHWADPGRRRHRWGFEWNPWDRS